MCKTQMTLCTLWSGRSPFSSVESLPMSPLNYLPTESEVSQQTILGADEIELPDYLILYRDT